MAHARVQIIWRSSARMSRSVTMPPPSADHLDGGEARRRNLSAAHRGDRLVSASGFQLNSKHAASKHARSRLPPTAVRQGVWTFAARIRVKHQHRLRTPLSSKAAWGACCIVQYVRAGRRRRIDFARAKTTRLGNITCCVHWRWHARCAGLCQHPRRILAIWWRMKGSIRSAGTSQLPAPLYAHHDEKSEEIQQHA